MEKGLQNSSMPTALCSHHEPTVRLRSALPHEPRALVNVRNAIMFTNAGVHFSEPMRTLLSGALKVEGIELVAIIGCKSLGFSEPKERRVTLQILNLEIAILIASEVFPQRR